MKVKVVPRQKSMDYLIVLLMILCSGTVVFNIKYNTIFIPFFCLFSIVNAGWQGEWSKKRLSTLIGVLTIIAINMMLHIFSGVAINGIIQVVLYLVGTFFACRTMTFERYKVVFINTISALSVFAISVFLLVNAGVLPHTKENINGSYYQMSMLHVVGWGDTVFTTRMCGLFHEPGMYQILLNLGVLYAIDNIIRYGMNRKLVYKLCFLVLAVIMTQSTAGYIVLCVNLSILYVKLHKRIKKICYKLLYYMLIPVAIIIGYSILMSEVVVNKFASTNVSYIIRSNDIFLGLEMLFENPILGYGYNSMLYDSVALSYGMDGMSNGMIGLFLMFGIPLSICLLIIYFKNMNKLGWSVSRKNVALVLLLEEMIESCFFFPAMIAFMFPYLQAQEKKSKR